MDAYINRRIY